ncbi:MAG: Na/Pi symporter [Alphaproteobacteria bacterium]|nr:Na/Pi symporter [Alphaproteobacteria bacterium]MBU0798022.1 Na/Pi symporter [Alphaproteobacteria bacterium]MBU0887562.1 Na/Pi symporter [Alphaproteobacteria bacterium]MBU1814213.1 Na/Pi symporter [Alphaproteobacteria bacterium]
MALTIATILAGLGLFFVGSEMLTSNLRSLASRKIQLGIARVASSLAMGLLWGAILGAITQSTQVATFILVGLLLARLIDPIRAFPIIIGANIGSSLIIFVVTMDITTVVLLALGATGIALTIQRLNNWQTILRAVFGLCLLYYGLTLLAHGAAPFAEDPFFQEMMLGTHGSPMAALAIGILLTVICQSSITVALLAITFAGSGFFSFEQAVMIIYGTNLGSSISTWMLSGKIRGTARQVAMYQVAFNIVGCVVLVPLFYVETLGDVPLLMALVQSLSSDLGHQLAIICLLFNVAAAVVLVPLLKPQQRLFEKLYPATRQEDDSRLVYLSERSIDDPEIATLMAEKEQLRLMARLPLYIEAMRLDEPLARTRRLTELHDSFASVHGQAGIYIHSMAEDGLTPENHDIVYRVVDRHNRLEGIEEALRHFADSAPLLEGSATLASIRTGLVEGLDAIMLTCIDGMESGDAEDMAMIERITGDRGDVMEGVRRSFLSDDTVALSREEKLGLMQLTGLFERLVFLLRDMALKAPLDSAGANT